MEPALRIGDLVAPTSATQPAFFRKHGFGVIIEVNDRVEQPYVLYVVKFTKSEQVYRFSFDGVKRYE